jgi:hypothetical protein
MNVLGRSEFTVSGFKPRHSKTDHRADKGKKHIYPKTRRKRTYSKPKGAVNVLPLNVYLHIPLKTHQPIRYRAMFLNKKIEGINTNLDKFKSK